MNDLDFFWENFKEYVMNKFALTMMLAVGTAFNALAEVPPELQGFEFLEDVLPKDEFGSVKIKQSTKRSMQKDIKRRTKEVQ